MSLSIDSRLAITEYKDILHNFDSASLFSFLDYQLRYETFELL